MRQLIPTPILSTKLTTDLHARPPTLMHPTPTDEIKKKEVEKLLTKYRVTDDAGGEDDDGGPQSHMPTYTERQL
jgi:hypothetical protein